MCTRFFIVIFLYSCLNYGQSPPFNNTLEQFQGRLAGVQIISNGAPNAEPRILVRGYSTWNNNDPLYVIDGVQTQDLRVFNSINPKDIHSVSVIKDASAAIYGSRGANGVIVVTTKQGLTTQKKYKKSPLNKKKRQRQKNLKKKHINPKNPN